MSGVGRTNAGAGGGGISSNVAVLQVTAPNGSIVTITNGSFSKTQDASKSHISDSDSTQSVYIFSIAPANFGAFTVTALHSGYSGTGTVTISSVKVYSVTIAYDFYLLYNKNFVDSVTWTLTGSPGSMTKITDSIDFRTMNSGNYATLATTDSAYTIDPFTTLHVKFVKHGNSGTNYGQSKSTDTCPAIILSTGIPTITTSTAVVSNYTALQKFTVTNNFLYTEEYALDVTNVSGSYYISLSISGSPYGANNQPFLGAMWLSDIWFD